MTGQAANLHGLLEASASRRPGHVAVENPGHGEISYGELDGLTGRVRDRLVRLGVEKGDRVGIYLTKSIDAVAGIFGALKAGGAYVPVDPTAPATRNGYVLGDCTVKVAIVEAPFVEGLRQEMGERLPELIVVERAGDGSSLGEALDRLDAERGAAPEVPSRRCDRDQLAYILYTSGSTGLPKGVMLTHRNAMSYVDWCGETFEPREDDRFSSHAPFHFDLSILDIYVPMKHGATLVLVGHDVGKNPAELAPLIAERRLTVWYSAPSTLSLLAQYGELGSRDYSALRMVFFAGEVFPVKHLRSLQRQLPHPRYFNLYGPTETNVCTFYEVTERVPEERTEPYPIGVTCSHLESWVIDESGRTVPAGEMGELCIRGPAVTQGYWNLPEQSAKAFIADGEGRRWYRTGDLVVEGPDGNFIFRGRRDRMVKKRGYRIELGEIEACLYRHPSVLQAATIAQSDEEGVRIKAFVSAREGKKLSVIALKRFCSEHLPVYMVPDTFSFQESLPTTSTDKVDYERLKKLR